MQLVPRCSLDWKRDWSYYAGCSQASTWRCLCSDAIVARSISVHLRGRRSVDSQTHASCECGNTLASRRDYLSGPFLSGQEGLTCS